MMYSWHAEPKPNSFGVRLLGRASGPALEDLSKQDLCDETSIVAPIIQSLQLQRRDGCSVPCVSGRGC